MSSSIIPFTSFPIYCCCCIVPRRSARLQALHYLHPLISEQIFSPRDAGIIHRWAKAAWISKGTFSPLFDSLPQKKNLLNPKVLHIFENQAERKSVEGYILTFNGCLISFSPFLHIMEFVSFLRVDTLPYTHTHPQSTLPASYHPDSRCSAAGADVPSTCPPFHPFIRHVALQEIPKYPSRMHEPCQPSSL